jgi:hypothetical protein
VPLHEATVVLIVLLTVMGDGYDVNLTKHHELQPHVISEFQSASVSSLYCIAFENGM